MEGMNWNLPVLALRGLTVFPHMSLSLDVEREVSLRALEKAMEGDQRIFLVTQREIGTEAPEERDLYEVGTVCAIRQILKMSGSTVRILVDGLCRAKLCRLWQTEPYLQANVEELGEAAFSDCEALEELHLPPHLRRMGARCFRECRALEEVTVPGSLRVLPERTFQNCTDLEKAVLHAGVERIGAEAFASAESVALLHVWIPETVTDIAPGAFERPGGTVLHGASGSKAEAYAKKNQLPFCPE